MCTSDSEICIKDPTVFDKRESYKINFNYPPKIDSTEDEMLKEMKESWPSVENIWMVEIELSIH